MDDLELYVNGEKVSVIGTISPREWNTTERPTFNLSLELFPTHTTDETNVSLKCDGVWLFNRTFTRQKESLPVDTMDFRLAFFVTCGVSVLLFGGLIFVSIVLYCSK